MPPTSASPPIPPVKLDLLAGVLSYLIPGLGQIKQGRVAKGVVFFVSLYALFFYGWNLGQRKNVYLADSAANDLKIGKLGNDLYNRPHFPAQFFIGIAAWPAIWQYMNYEERKEEGPVFGRMMRAPSPEEINRLQRESGKEWDLGWVYTVIAGVLNILVIYDAVAGPAFREVTTSREKYNHNGAPAATATKTA